MKLKLAFALMSLILVLPVHSEPWLANNVAKNCAACHAPGRINKPPQGRRCTLSCQGCHVNPNGGGMRNAYGKWNSERFLQSFRSKSWHHKALPEVEKKQTYVKILDKYLGAKRKRRLTKKTEAKAKKILAKPRTMKVRKESYVPDEEYHQNDRPRWKITAQDDLEFMSQVPHNDPYRIERRNDVMASGDLRLLNVSIDRGNGGERENLTWTMSADLGVRWRPTPEHVAVVLESRFLNGPTNGSFDDVFRESQVRSGYLLIDDLAYNIHAMYGLYRPMFGHFNPDHESLMNDLSGLNQRVVYRALGIGAAPNVPYGSIHILDPGNNQNITRDKGYVINLGGRFVSYGASGQFSYWSTENDSSGTPIKRTMYSVTVGGSIRRLTSNFEYLVVEQEDTGTGSVDRGAAFWLENKYQLWRKVFLMLNYGQSNVARTLGEGSASEMALGAKAFLLNGIELEVLYINRDDTVGTTDTATNLIQTQLHLFF